MMWMGSLMPKAPGRILPPALSAVNLREGCDTPERAAGAYALDVRLVTHPIWGLSVARGHAPCYGEPWPLLCCRETPVSRDLVSKPEIREHTWRLLEIHQAVRFPGAKGWLPNFVGAERAALVLRTLPIWRRARAIKANPGAPQIPVGRMAL